ncbi:hypothetical protein [Cupriavidus gilardii]|uniref:hypothetical protein n=1 Tax=Cupriavidus gilardii TaxID=82541 RepID=UPI0015724F4E|nr:hypothetical protein [Cupriavidus gilardii]NSX03127.1 hypothetical protein [Cupriavidus gilardii]
MDWQQFEQAFSSPRVGRYLAHCRGNRSMAMEAYRHNLLIAGALTPFLAVVEVCLRNAINRQLVDHYGRLDWWEAWRGVPLFEKQSSQVVAAKAKLLFRKEPVTPDKIIAELTFGFWVTLFNAEFQAFLWKPLRKMFRHLPKVERQRHNVSPILNRLRALRNRVFHHESVLWLSPSDLGQIYKEGVAMLAWIDDALPRWCNGHCQVQAAWSAWSEADRRLHTLLLRTSQSGAPMLSNTENRKRAQHLTAPDGAISPIDE